MRRTVENEAHICNAPNGHMLSVDCWCEPVAIRVVRNKRGINVLVVEHNDDTLSHRFVVVAERERDQSKPYETNHPNASWITRALTPPWTPPLLPPHEGDAP
jgi:hypothetical protein